jgi:hypothetical protein
MNMPGGENVAMPLRDARLEELEYLAELERDWEGRTEKHAGDTPRRRLIAHLILVGDVNGADYLGQLPVNVRPSTIRSATMLVTKPSRAISWQLPACWKPGVKHIEEMEAMKSS